MYVYEVALVGSVHETGVRWDIHTFPLVGHTQKLYTWLIIILIDMHWWDLNTKSFQRFSAIMNTY